MHSVLVVSLAEPLLVPLLVNSWVVSWGLRWCGQLGPLLASVCGLSTSRDSGTCKIQSVLRGLQLVCPFLRGFHFWEGTHCNGLNLGREG